MAATVFSGGTLSSRTPQFGTFGDFATQQTVYVTPGYLLRAARRKYGGGIDMIGAVESELANFWDTVEAKGTASFEGPQQFPHEVGRIVVDITAKEHCNYGSTKDEIEVVTSHEETRKEKKSYSLSFGKQTGWEFGGGLNVGASFFNTAGASVGIGGKRNKGKWNSEEERKEEERALSQTYGVTGKIDVPPKTKVAVTITTYAVTYKLNVKVEFSVPATSYIPFYYKNFLGRLCCAGAGPTCRKFGHITAQELFKNEENFQDLGHTIQFMKDSELSYVAEAVEMCKKELPLWQ